MTVKKKIKIVIFGDLNNIICRVLFWQMMKLSKEKNIELIKFYNTAKNNENLIKNIINFIFIKIFNPLKHNFFLIIPAFLLNFFQI